MHRFEGVVVSLALVINLDTLLQRLDHVGRRGRALNRALDVLNEVRRVDDRPLRFCLVREAKKPHEQR